MDSLLSTFDRLNLKTPQFQLTQCDHSCTPIFVTKINLNFYQLWSLFGELPIVTEQSDSVRCYTFVVSSKVDPKELFFIYANGYKGSLLNLISWNIGTCQGVDPIHIQNFLEYLFDALKCFETYYQQNVSQLNFNHPNEIVQDNLNHIKNSLLHYHDVLVQL